MTSVNGSGPVAELAYELLGAYLASFEGYREAANSGMDAEAIHQMRVNARRLRAVTRAFAPILPEQLVGLDSELRWIAASLGAVRDIDVLIEGHPDLADSFGELRSSRLAQMRIDLASQRCADLSELLARLIGERTVLNSDLAATPIYAAAPDIVSLAFRRVKRAARKLDQPQQIHALRKKAKRLRYTFDCFAEHYGKPAKRFTASLKALQERLGSFQDAVVAEGLYASLGIDNPYAQEARDAEDSIRSDLPDLLDQITCRWKPLRKRMDEQRCRAWKPGWRKRG